MECVAKQFIWNQEGRKIGDTISYKCSCRCLSQEVTAAKLLATQNLPNAKFSICARVTDPAIKILTTCANYLSQSEEGSIKKAHV